MNRDEVHDDEIGDRCAASFFLGRSRAAMELRAHLELVSASDATVLIRGETGTGKGLVARLIHEASARRVQPFVQVDCTTLAATLIESELFGHEKGAFTGASTRHEGRFERVGGGTILLDEIGDMDPALQAKLLRVIQDRCFERVGGRSTLPMRARVIAATHRNLEEAVDRGDFRRDLYFRLSVVDLEIPPLRERQEDIELLAQDSLTRASRSAGITAPAIRGSFHRALRGHDWPGNVRELDSFMQRAAIFAAGRELDGELATRLIRHRSHRRSTRTRIAAAVSTPRAADDAAGREDILAALIRSQGNISRAARELRMPRSTLRYRMERMELSTSIETSRNPSSRGVSRAVGPRRDRE